MKPIETWNKKKSMKCIETWNRKKGKWYEYVDEAKECQKLLIVHLVCSSNVVFDTESIL